MSRQFSKIFENIEIKSLAFPVISPRSQDPRGEPLPSVTSGAVGALGVDPLPLSRCGELRDPYIFLPFCRQDWQGVLRSNGVPVLATTEDICCAGRKPKRNGCGRRRYGREMKRNAYGLAGSPCGGGRRRQKCTSPALCIACNRPVVPLSTADAGDCARCSDRKIAVA